MSATSCVSLLPADGDQSLNASAREHFAALVVSNTQCRTLFFDLFMPSDSTCASVSDFRSNGAAVTWMRKRLSGTTKVVFENKIAERTVWHTSPESVPALLYGLRYWARDELKLIDECSQRTDGRVLMFPVYGRTSSTHQDERSVRKAVRFLLDHRTADEWTLFSISDLIVDYCQTHRQPRAVLFAAIAWLRTEWPHHTVLIPTSHGLATLTAKSPQQEALELRRYYKSTNGPYISHFRIHETVTTEPTRYSTPPCPTCFRSSSLSSTLSSRPRQARLLRAHSFHRRRWPRKPRIFSLATRQVSAPRHLSSSENTEPGKHVFCNRFTEQYSQNISIKSFYFDNPRRSVL